MPLKIGSVIGIIGCGQLGRMLAMSAAQLGYHTHIYAPEIESPAFEVAHNHTIAPYDDIAKLHQFASQVEVITNEFENIPSATAQLLAGLKPLYPSPKLFSICQNRVSEKEFINDNGGRTADYAVARSLHDLRNSVAKVGTPCIAKSTTLGYDGKGQLRINSIDDCEDVWEKLSAVELMVEAFVPFESEASIIIARDQQGEIALFPIAQNIHENGVLRQSFAPAHISDASAAKMQKIARNLAIAGELIGILAVECFILPNGEVLVNELAARPHNSGHYTMDGCNISQFEQLIRICAGLPMVEPKLLHPTKMLNLLGNEVLELEQYWQNPNARLHIYGKDEIIPARKMAHVNLLNLEQK